MRLVSVTAMELSPVLAQWMYNTIKKDAVLILPAMPSTCRHRTGSINTEIQNKPSFELAISQHQK